MSNLVPVKRVDKNGVLTTKHVRASSAPSGAKSSIPAPAVPEVPSKPLRAPSGATIVARLQEREEELYGADASHLRHYSFILEHIKKFPASVRKDLHDFIGSASKNDHDNIKMLFRDHYSEPQRFNAYVNTIDDMRWVSECVGEDSGYGTPEAFRQIFDNLKLNEWGEDLTQYHFGVIKTEHLARKLRISESTYSVPHEYYRDLDTIRVNYGTIAPALPVVFAYKKAHENAFSEKMKDKSLPIEERRYKKPTAAGYVEVAEYVQQNYPEHVDVIARTILERGSFDRDIIDSMMNSKASAVAAGIL